ncbi:hypothetical protein ABT263_14470 [Kitasatospora sp. NPDC001603]|uniref:hypothetical protein n=1 Tax=Kitasatospora sp. NPDC001603 TaxID=3154388 RepID=UPI003331CA40
MPGSTARLHLLEARGLTVGPQEPVPGEGGFERMWGSMADARGAVGEGRLLLQGGPPALLLADRSPVAAGAARPVSVTLGESCGGGPR